MLKTSSSIDFKKHTFKSVWNLACHQSQRVISGQSFSLEHTTRVQHWANRYFLLWETKIIIISLILSNNNADCTVSVSIKGSVTDTEAGTSTGQITAFYRPGNHVQVMRVWNIDRATSRWLLITILSHTGTTGHHLMIWLLTTVAELRTSIHSSFCDKTSTCYWYKQNPHSSGVRVGGITTKRYYNL